jgi:hypothetical protein
MFHALCMEVLTGLDFLKIIRIEDLEFVIAVAAWVTALRCWRGFEDTPIRMHFETSLNGTEKS